MTMIFQEAHSAGYLDGDTPSLRVVRCYFTALRQIYICGKTNSHVMTECTKCIDRPALNVPLLSQFTHLTP